ncbi:MAG: DUF2141 domain-containing protein [Alphaproteobacteria bacterium]|nr:DUF2141 domain-containing protein [Alphaproteobacteria bacterium]MBU1524780.1 DUF2141 domain-containing protein [Alphaproteobacteria bacterium]MBU2349920.1 DUF2141 domain-containing protein [Alphaproteobacteria bacterium]MBU2383663.1 DUF2141 domain-containing protein [Alphaproteobacteria bacterium]
MKMIALVGTLALTALAAPAFAQSTDVTVTLTGVEARGGQILASLAGPDTFMRGQPEHSARGEVVAGTVTLTFRDVPVGDWALMAMHDENANGEFDMNGYMPAEGYAFSNLGGPLMGMPSFGMHKVAVAAGTTITAPMIYP